MPTIGALKVVLTAKTATFVRGMARAGRTVKTFTGKFTGLAARMSRVGARFSALGALLAGGGFAALATRAASSLDKLGKTADKLGASTGGLATLRHMAQLSGVEIAGFDTGLQRMVRRVAEAAQGLGKTGQTLRDLGLDAKELTKLPADEMFIKVTKALAQIQNPAIRVQKAFKLWDMGGVAIVNMLDAVNNDLARFQKLAEDLGIIFTRAQVKQVEDMNDAFLNLRTKIGAVVNHLVVEAAPKLTALFSGLTKTLGSPQELARAIVGGLQRAGVAILQFADWVIPKLGRALVVMANAMQLFLEIAEQMARFFRVEIPEGFTKMRESLAKFTVGLDRQIAELEKPGGGFGARFLAWMKGRVALIKGGAEAYAKGRTAIERLLGGLGDERAPTTATIGLAAPSAFGGLRGGGRVAGFASGTVQMRVQNEQLEELKQINAGVKKLQPKGLGH